MPRIYYGIFLTAAAAMLVAALVTGVAAVQAKFVEQSVQGYIVDMVAGEDATGTAVDFPVIRFTLADGSRQTVRTAGSAPSAYKVDDPVTILYDPAQPDQAYIASSDAALNRWIAPAITSFLSVVFLLTTALVYRVFGLAQT